MRNTFKKITRTLFLFATLLLVSCSKDVYEEQSNISEKESIVKKVSLKDAFAKQNKKLQARVSQLKIYKSNKTGKLEYNEMYNFYIDEENGIYIDSDGKESYTFPIYKAGSDGTIENIIFNENSSGDFDVIVADYDFTKEELESMTEEDVLESDVVYTDISKIGAPNIICVEIETTTTVYPPCNHTHSNGVTCQPQTTTVTQTKFCINAGPNNNEDPSNTGGGSSSGGSSSGGGNTSGGQGGGYGGGSSSNTGGMSTSPTSVLSQAQYQFLNSLNATTTLDLFYGLNENVINLVLNYINTHNTTAQIEAVSNFFNNPNSNILSNPNIVWLSNQSAQSQQSIFNYLIANGFSNESKSFVQNLINYSENNGNTPGVIKENNNILSLLTNGTVNGLPVDLGDSTPITNMTQYLSCFNISQGAVLTIAADQPDAGDHDLFTLNGGVGHSFITIKQGTKVRSLGFYPKVGALSIMPNNLTPDPNDFFNTPGEFHNNENTSYDVSLSVPITASQLSNLINGTVNFANNNPVYNLSSLNCTDIAIVMFETNTNVNLPSCESPNILWDGQTPGTLGEIIRDLPTPVGGTKDTNSGTSPQNNG